MQDNIVEVQGVLIDLKWPKIFGRIKHNLIKGWYEANEAKAAKLLLQDGDIVLEIGGGCGFLSAFVAKLGRASRVITVEADPELIPIMEQTHALNHVSVEIFNEVLSETSGWTDFYVCDEFWVSSRTPTVQKLRHKLSVPTASFQARLAEWQPNLLIVDIEGGERELFRQPLARSVDRIIVEVHGWAYGPSGIKEVMDRISDLGFAYVPSASVAQVLSYQRLGG
jgi:FkbM family methyltransferase